jgi:hypothetical protein
MQTDMFHFIILIRANQSLLFLLHAACLVVLVFDRDKGSNPWSTTLKVSTPNITPRLFCLLEE